MAAVRIGSAGSSGFTRNLEVNLRRRRRQAFATHKFFQESGFQVLPPRLCLSPTSPAHIWKEILPSGVFSPFRIPLCCPCQATP